MKIQRNSLCLCGSGIKYKKCCIDKSFEFIFTEDGDLQKRVTLHIDDNMMEILKRQRQHLIDTFGREPSDEDYVFFSHYADSEEEHEHAVVAAMDLGGVPPQLIYAFKKTGRMVTQSNKAYLTTVELEEWNDAIDEYFNVYVNTPGQKYDKLLENITEEFGKVKVIFALLSEQMEYRTHLGLLEKLDEMSTDQFIHFCTAKTGKTIRAVEIHIEKYLTEDGYSLLRTIYENYLSLLFVLKEPTQIKRIIASHIGIESGRYRHWVNEKGKTSKEKLVELETGEVYRKKIKTYEMAQSSNYEEDVLIFDYLYNKLSKFVHPNISAVRSYVRGNSFDSNKWMENHDLVVLSMFVSVIILDLLLGRGLITLKMAGDVMRLIIRLIPKITEYFKVFGDRSEFFEVANPILVRLEKVASRMENITYRQNI